MADEKTTLPEGTDKIIEGVAEPTLSNSGALGIAADNTNSVGNEADVLIVTDVEVASLEPGGTDATSTGGPVADEGTSAGGRPNTAGMMDRVRGGREKLAGQAADKARGLVGQGLERSAEALANVGRLVGDTAEGLDERLGPEYGDYARRAAGAIEDAANSIASKDADELIEDTRNFVRNSPGVALAGAAVVGFALARLIKSGLAGSDGTRDGRTGS